MNEHKQSKFIIDVSAPAKRPNRSTTRFFSYDSHTAEIVIQAEKDGKIIDQALVDAVDIYFESVNIKYRPIDGLKWNDTMEIGTDGLYSYVLPDDFLNYEGLVAFDVYINYKNGDKADSSNRIIFEQRVSAIDRAAGAVELVYIKDMEDAKQAVADKADEVMADMSGYESSLADYEHQIKNGMDQLYDGVTNASADEITKIRAELPKVETAATEEITKIQAVLPDVQATAADETAKIKAQLPIVEAVAAAETEKIQAELPKVAAVTTDEITKIKAELPKVQSVTAEETTKIQSELPIVQTVATEEIGKIRDVLSTVEQTAQEVSDHADQRIAEYDAKFVSADQKMTELEQSQVALDAELKATQQQIADADVYTKAEADANAEVILDKRNLSPAWSWSEDGTDRFTTVYPGENLLSDTLPDKFPKIENYNQIPENAVNLSHDEYGNVIVTGTMASVKPYYFSGGFKANQILSDDFLNNIRGKRLSASVDMAFDSTNSITPNQVGISIYVWSASGAFISPNRRKTKYESEMIWIDTIIPEDAINVVVAIRVFDGPSWVGEKITFSKLKLEITDYILPSTTIYTPAPSEDYANAYPKYKGLRLAPSDNPADYDWSYTDEYVDYLKNSSVSKTEFNDLAARLAALENKEV